MYWQRGSTQTIRNADFCKMEYMIANKTQHYPSYLVFNIFHLISIGIVKFSHMIVPPQVEVKYKIKSIW